jgi:hypothetical protein
LNFAAKPLDGFRMLDEIRTDDLERYGTTHEEVFGQPNTAHSAPTEQSLNAISGMAGQRSRAIRVHPRRRMSRGRPQTGDRGIVLCAASVGLASQAIPRPEASRCRDKELNEVVASVDVSNLFQAPVAMGKVLFNGDLVLV